MCGDQTWPTFLSSIYQVGTPIIFKVISDSDSIWLVLLGFIQVGPEKVLIEDLVRSYIKGNCIILMVLAMNGKYSPIFLQSH